MSDLSKKVFVKNVFCYGGDCNAESCCPGTTPDTPDTPDNPNPGGAPAVHAPTHAAGGSDVLEYSSLSGLPDLSLKQDKLPDVAGNEGKFLGTDGTALSWETIGGGGGADEGSPIGSIKLWPMTTPEPDKYLFCNGDTLATTKYPKLFAVMGHQYDLENTDNTKFQLPKLKNLSLDDNVWSNTGSGHSAWTNIHINPTTNDIWAVSSSSVKVLRKGTGEWIPMSNITGGRCITVHPVTGDVWVGIYSGEIKVLRGGVGAWQSTNSGTADWISIAINPINGDVWACGYMKGEVKVLRGGAGAWQSTNSGISDWAYLNINPSNGDVWAGVYSTGLVHVLREGKGTWQPIAGKIVQLSNIAINPINGDVWASGNAGSLVKVLREGKGTWQTTGSSTSDWRGLVVNPITGDVWASIYKGEVMVLRGGTGSWLSVGSGIADHYNIAIDQNNDIWVCVLLGIIKSYLSKNLKYIIKAE